MMLFRPSPLRSAWLARIVGALALVALALVTAGDRTVDRGPAGVAASVALAALQVAPAADASRMTGARAWVESVSAPADTLAAAGTSAAGKRGQPVLTADRCWAVDPASDHLNPDPELPPPAGWAVRVVAVGERVPPAPDLPGFLRPPCA